MPPEIGRLHFVGIGGIGMSGIAEVLHQLGYAVQGSDVADSYNTRRLAEKGIRVVIGHKAENLTDEDGRDPVAVVASSAIKNENPEILAARAKNIPVIHRSEMLAELMRLKKAVAIAGTHGKTTTTSLVGCMLEAGGFDPTVINGGIVNAYGTNVRLGEGDYMVVEADESDGTFTRLPAFAGVITNIDPEHLDHYGDFDGVREAFRTYIRNLPFYGFGVLCVDHPEVEKLAASLTDRRIVTYGFKDGAMVRGVNVDCRADGSTFDVVTPDRRIEGIRLGALGRHNVQNALAAVAVGLELGMADEAIRQALADFTGVKRRFTRTGIARGVTVIDDYGHHPVEIRAVLSTARTVQDGHKGRVIAVMQPHRYTRLNALFDDFAACFEDADAVIIADVYPAGETPIAGADKDHLAAAIARAGHKNVRSLDDPKALAALVAATARPGDMVVCLGAGSITYWAQTLPAELEILYETGKGQAA